MQKENSIFPQAEASPDASASSVSRRKFFGYAGLSATALVALSSCTKVIDEFNNAHNNIPNDLHAVYLGSGDIGILNYAYALEQLEAAFYTRVCQMPYSGITDKERMYLLDIKYHEIAHREFFKVALGSKAIGMLEVDFSSINFSSRDSVLATAKAFEDLGVSAYNGAGELLKSVDYLLLAGKIVSVEARHAAAIRDLISYGSFADNTVVDMNGLDVYRKPPEVLAIAGTYIKTPIIATDLPTS